MQEDITSRKKQIVLREQDLHRATFKMEKKLILKKYLNLFANYLNEGIIFIDNKKKVSQLNESGKKILGIRKNIRANTNIDAIIKDKNCDLYKLIETSYNSGKNIKNYELTYHRSLKNIKLLVSIIVFENPDNTKERFLLVIFSDITSTWKLFLKERELLNHLRENYLHHMENLKQISDNIAHEVRNPIVSIGAYANLLHKKCNMFGKNNKEAKKYINYILKDTERLDKLVSQAEKYTNTEEIRLRKEDVKKIISDALKYGNRLSKKFNVVFEHSNLNKEKYLVYADKGKLKEAFRNLIKQSMFLSRKESHLKINVNFSPYTIEMFIDIHTNKISEVNAHHILNPFFSVSDQEPNFDLAIAQRIIILHGGLIKVDLQNKHNLSIDVSLPKEKRITER